MKLTKRETILVAVLLGLLAIAGAYVLLFAPLREKAEALRAEAIEVDEQKTQMELLLLQPHLQQNYDDETETAKDHYQSFYATLNTFTIDSILSGLMDEQNLHVKTMRISSYEPAPPEDLPGASDSSEPLPDGTISEGGLADGGSQEEESLLLQSTVEIEGGGDFANVMGFLDAMNEKSFCLSVEDLKIAYRTDQNLLDYETEFSFRVRIYGVATPEGITLT